MGGCRERFKNMDYIYKFERAMFEQGISIRERIIPDGELHRVHIEGDKIGSKNGWYVLYTNPIIVGIFGSWKLGNQYKWINNDSITLQNQHLVAQKIEELKQKKAKEKELIHKKVAQESALIWGNLKSPAPINHPYLIKKRINGEGTKIKGSALVAPIIDFDNNIHCLQYIYPDGTKRFSTGGKKSGNFILVNYNANSKFILIAEGFATSKTLQEFHPDYTILAALDSGNLKPVVSECVKRFPDKQIIICADDDRLIPGNPGRTKALEASSLYGVQVIFPEWPSDSPNHLTDFNDLHLFLNKDVL